MTNLSNKYLPLPNECKSPCCDDCSCCPCLAGFLITVEGWENNDCTCHPLNTTVFAPVSENTWGPECPKEGGGGDSATEYSCPPENVAQPARIRWRLYCANGVLNLEIIQESTNVVVDESGVVTTGFRVRVHDEVDCTALSLSKTAECNTELIPDCLCPTGIKISATPVFGGPESPPHCQCCQLDEPLPETLSLTLTDNCSGSITLDLVRADNCWEGTYGTVCQECSPVPYVVQASLCCVDGIWTFRIIVISPDTCSPFCWSSVPSEDAEDQCVLMEPVICSPFLAFSDISNATSCEWYTCPPQSGPYVIFSFIITDPGL